MLELGIDEYTIVLHIAPNLKSMLGSNDWVDVAGELIDTFIEKSGFIQFIGELSNDIKAPEGYTDAITFGCHGFYLAVAYHEYRMDMGIIVKFSAQALDYYCEQTNLKPYEFLQIIQDDSYCVRLSRVDFTVDYIDESLDVTTLYHWLIKKEIGIFREYINPKSDEPMQRRCDLKVNGFIKGEEVPTIYLGSVQSNARLRIYDKKQEQIERKGTKYDKAVQCQSWVRFEGVFRNIYAHQLGDALLTIRSDEEYADLIATTMIQKFNFMHIDSGVICGITWFSQLLLNLIKNGQYVLKSTSTKNYDLLNSIEYLFQGSGVITTLYKIKEIWGDDALLTMLTEIQEHTNNFIPNYDCRKFIRTYQEDYRNQFPKFDDYIAVLSYQNLTVKGVMI